MAAFLPKLVSGWHVDQAILAEESRVVVIRFGHDYVSCLPLLSLTLLNVFRLTLGARVMIQNDECMVHDETLFGIAEKIKNFAVICEDSFSSVSAFELN